MTERVLTILPVAIVFSFLNSSISAQSTAAVRVVSRTANVVTRPSTDAPTIGTADHGAILEVVDRTSEWYAVTLPPDPSGARSRGWVRAADVQVVSAANATAPIRDPQAAQPSARPTSDPIPPSAEALRLEQAQRLAEQRQREREAAQQARQAGHPGATETSSSSHASFAPRPKYEIFGGYSLLWDTSDSVSFPLGWSAAVSRQVTDSLGIVGEVSGSYKSTTALGTTLTQHIHTFTAGPRFSRQTGSLTAFGQIQGGLEASSGSLFGYSTSSTGFALVPGVGVDVPIAQSLGVHLGGEFGIIRNLGGWYNSFRLTTGLVLMSKR